jgi:hypothetical protein
MRTKRLWQAAEHLGELVAGGEISRSFAERRLLAAAEVAGLRRNDALRQIQRGLDKGEARPRPAPRGRDIRNATEARLEVITWCSVVYAAVSASTGRKIVAAVTEIALRAGKVSIAFSERELAERAGVARSTVHKYLHGELSRFLRPRRRGSRLLGTRSEWLLVVSRAHQRDRLETSSIGCSDCAVDARDGEEQCTVGAREYCDWAHDMGADFWHRWAGGWEIFHALDVDEACTAAEVAEHLGRANVGSVRRSLNRLRDDGLAVRDDTGGWRRVPHAELPGTPVPYSAERCERHEREREMFAEVRRRKLDERGVPTLDPEAVERDAIERLQRVLHAEVIEVRHRVQN